jgi:DNA-binding transcriptional regulator YiaG
MTSQEFQSLQKDAGMKNQDVERMFGVSDQTVINWRKGNTRIPLAVQTLIRMKAEKGKSRA